MQPYTIAFWLRTDVEMKQGIVLHRQAGTDTGFHGTELSFDDGRLFFALVRFWPGNAIAIRTKDKIPRRRMDKRCNHLRRLQHSRRYGDLRQRRAGNYRHYPRQALQEPGSRRERDHVRRTLPLGRPQGRSDRRAASVRSISVRRSKSHKSTMASRSPRRWQTRTPTDFATTTLRLPTRKSPSCCNELKEARLQVFPGRTRDFRNHGDGGNARATAGVRLPSRRVRRAARATWIATRPAVMPPFPPDAPRNRLGLSRWLTHPDHPLTARVAVNRYWQLFFGHGLVATTENFGTQGALALAPGVARLAGRDFVASGWDVQRLCKQIVLSSTYRQRSAASRELRDRDPDNVLLARGPARRLSAEMLRDSALATSGLLVRKLGGPPVKPYQPPGLWKGQNAFLPEYVPDKGESLYRRTLYTFWRRTSPPPNMLALDAAPREVCTVRRQTTSTPIQPLVLLNDPQWVEAARALACACSAKAAARRASNWCSRSAPSARARPANKSWTSSFASLRRPTCPLPRRCRRREKVPCHWRA